MSHGSHNKCTVVPEPTEPGVPEGGASTGIRSLRVLVANEPRAYRETISTVIAQVRPHLEILTTEPADLDWKVQRLLPELVVCSGLSRTVESEAPAWIDLYPEGASQTVVSINGKRYTHPGMDFDTLLSTIDRAVSLRK